MLRNFFVYKIQYELSGPKSTENFSGLSRNAPLQAIFYFIKNIEVISMSYMCI